MKKAKKVLFVINNLSGGGAERILVNILNNLNSNNIEPTLYLFEKEGKYLKDLNKNINIISTNDLFLYEYGEGLIGKVKKYTYRYTIGMSHLKKIMKDYDLVVSFLEKSVTYITTKAASKVGIPCYCWIHNNLDDSLSNLHFILSNIAYKKADKVISVSKECEEIAKKRFPILEKKIETIYNPIDIDNIRKKSLENNEFKLPDKINIVAIGRLNYQKGFDVLLKSFEKVSRLNSEVHLSILGEGELEDELKQLCSELKISDKVSFLGFIENPYCILQQSDIFVLSSRYEGLPTVLIEALALNLNIVSTKCSGVNEILEKGKYGILVEIDNVESLYQGLKLALKQNKNNNFEQKTNDFQLVEVIKQIEESLLNDELKVNKI